MCPPSTQRIDVMLKPPTATTLNQGSKSFSIIEELSPDGLFMRSKLRVHGAEFNDFGKYNCTIANELGQDSMIIDMQPIAPGKFSVCYSAEISCERAYFTFNLASFTLGHLS